jgi:large subunit ribosomal protein L3
MKVLIGKKVGMTRIFKEDGSSMAVTIVDISDNVVSRVIKTNEIATHIEIGKGKEKKSSKPDLGNYKELKYVPQVREVVKLSENENPSEIGTNLTADVFEEGEKIDVISYNKGKGFQGVVKRWGFKGGKRTHGQSDRERAPGSIGERMTPGRVFKGQRMGGHMGNVQNTIKGLRIAKVLVEDNLIVLSGSIPGGNGSYLVVKSVK